MNDNELDFEGNGRGLIALFSCHFYEYTERGRSPRKVEFRPRFETSTSRILKVPAGNGELG
jgi:hypothetical protein